MPPTIHLVRHAQGYHNISVENETMHDPDLTPVGEQQCRDLRKAFPYHDKINALIASPMRRTLYTCIHAFGEENLYPITALDTLQELSDLPSDTGSSPSQIRQEFGDKVDVSQVREEWTQKFDGQLFEPTLVNILTRAKESRQMIREIANIDSDRQVVVVCHGAFLHWLSDEWNNIPMPYPTNWQNCEYRSYQFVDPTGLDDGAAMVETDESWRRRCGSISRPTEEEHHLLRQKIQLRIVPTLKVKI